MPHVHLVGFVVLLGCAATALGCSDDVIGESPDFEVCLDRRDGARYCIDTYEASKKDATAEQAGSDTVAAPRSVSGVVPWTDVTWEAARSACEVKGRRLCERDEWIDACDGQIGEAEGTRFTYGDAAEPTLCNTQSTVTATTGAYPECTGLTKTFDQSGNVWEWTGNTLASAAARGGGYRSSQTHECKSGDTIQIAQPTDATPEVGFRCCRTP